MTFQTSRLTDEEAARRVAELNRIDARVAEEKDAAFGPRNIDQKKIIPAGASLHKRNPNAFNAHSNSTGPSEVAFPSTVDAFSSPSNLLCSRLQPETSN